MTEHTLDQKDEAVINDLMAKVTDDVQDAIMKTAMLIHPRFALPLAHKGQIAAMRVAATLLDINNGTPLEKSPTQESMALVAALAYNEMVGTEHPWNDAVTAVQCRFPHYKVANINVVDRRKKKQAEAA